MESFASNFIKRKAPQQQTKLLVADIIQHWNEIIENLCIIYELKRQPHQNSWFVVG
jgi:hypothetical protein